MQRRLTSANIREIVHVSNISLNYALYTDAKSILLTLAKWSNSSLALSAKLTMQY
ncbi:MAG: hypothetical protein H9535_08520 [Ignavibacteria bacterium]|nr:hypothetical protein [Ignavibacteria bacterium]